MTGVLWSASLVSLVRNNRVRPAKPVMPVEERVVLGLEATLQDEESSIRRQAAWALGLLSVDEAVVNLGMALADPSKDVRMAALRALAHIGTDEAGSQLVTVLMEPSRRMQGEAIDALGKVGYKPAAPQLLFIYDAAQGREMGDRALTALARIGAPEARGVFLQNMTSSDPSRRRWAVEGMGRLRNENLAGSLTKDFLREPEPSVQSAYCFRLGTGGKTGVHRSNCLVPRGSVSARAVGRLFGGARKPLLDGARSLSIRSRCRRQKGHGVGARKSRRPGRHPLSEATSR